MLSGTDQSNKGPPLTPVSLRLASQTLPDWRRGQYNMLNAIVSLSVAISATRQKQRDGIALCFLYVSDCVSIC